MMEYQYSKKLRIMHWVVAFFLIFMFFDGVIMNHVLKESANRQFIVDIHKSFGIVTLLLVIFRLFVRLSSKIPEYVDLSKPFKIAAKLTHCALYLVMITVSLSGFIVMMSREKIMIFGVEIPKLFSVPKALLEISHFIHVNLPYFLAGIVSLHLFAVLYHHFIKKDKIWEKIKL